MQPDPYDAMQDARSEARYADETGAEPDTAVLAELDRRDADGYAR